jgi:hypothetical protein
MGQRLVEERRSLARLMGLPTAAALAHRWAEGGQAMSNWHPQPRIRFRLGRAWRVVREKMRDMERAGKPFPPNGGTPLWFMEVSGPTGNPPQWDAKVWRHKQKTFDTNNPTIVTLRSKHRWPQPTSEAEALESLIEVIDEYVAARKAKGKKP